MVHAPSFYYFFFFNDTATTEIYPLSLHDALPISSQFKLVSFPAAPDSTPHPVKVNPRASFRVRSRGRAENPDRKSTRLNSSHLVISYAVFCLKKKNNYNATLALRWHTTRTT